MNILVVLGHPEPGKGHLCCALADAYAEGARSAGHTVAMVQVAQLDFPLLRSKQDWESGALPDGLRAAQEAMQDAQHLVLVFPLWLGGMPALLKGFLEQVLRPGLHTHAQPEAANLAGHMHGRSARIVVTMGMPAFVFRWYFQAHGVKALSRGILGFIGYAPVRTTLIGSVDQRGRQAHGRWLDRMRAWGRDAR